ncbi:hypothetical protein SF23_05640 [Streptomyces sp. MBRL 10]|nr:hypothetical protein SF23_05640 [Streptomyces sp. MBRL 10]
MHHALRDALPVEAGELLEQLLVLDQERATEPAVAEFWLSATGAPDSVVSVRFDMVTFRTGNC